MKQKKPRTILAGGRGKRAWIKIHALKKDKQLALQIQTPFEMYMLHQAQIFFKPVK